MIQHNIAFLQGSVEYYEDNRVEFAKWTTLYLKLKAQDIIQNHTDLAAVKSDIQIKLENKERNLGYIESDFQTLFDKDAFPKRDENIEANFEKKRKELELESQIEKLTTEVKELQIQMLIAERNVEAAELDFVQLKVYLQILMNLANQLGDEKTSDILLDTIVKVFGSTATDFGSNQKIRISAPTGFSDFRIDSEIEFSDGNIRRVLKAIDEFEVALAQGTFGDSTGQSGGMGVIRGLLNKGRNNPLAPNKKLEQEPLLSLKCYQRKHYKRSDLGL